MEELRDQFPFIATMYTATIALIMFLIHWSVFLIFVLIIAIIYFAARYKWGRARVHDWLNRETDEPTPWC